MVGWGMVVAGWKWWGSGGKEREWGTGREAGRAE